MFIETLPAWIAALIGAGVLAAVMSTADGLVVSTAQIFANDIFRRTIAPRSMPDASPEEVDRIALLISRIATVLVLIGAIALAWGTRDMNIALLVWVGVGGMMAAIAGPMFLGIFWRGATRIGALTGFIVGGVSFTVLKAGLIDGSQYSGNIGVAATWLQSQAVNPFACATIGVFCAVAAMYLVSLVTPKLDDAHLARVFGN